MPFLLMLALLMIGLIAYWFARDGHQLDLDRGLKAFLVLFAILGWTMYARETFAQSRALDNALVTMRNLSEIAVRGRDAVDSTQVTVGRALGRAGR